MLEGYAVGPLSPDEETLARMRATVRAAFADSQLSRDPGPSAEAGAARVPSAGWRIWSRRRRRAFASICAVAILTLSSVGLAGAESNPGQPFYRLRLGIEAVNLPFQVQPSPLDAALTRAESRLAEAGDEAASADWNAAADAVNAYRETLGSIALPGDQPAAVAALQRLDLQLARLEQLRGASHPPETAALDGAIAALCDLMGIPIPTPTPAPATASPSPRPTDKATATGSASPKEGDPGRDGASPKPNPSGSAGRSGDPDGGHASPTPSDADGGGSGSGGGKPRH
jgi:hypothetical protein